MYVDLLQWAWIPFLRMLYWSWNSFLFCENFFPQSFCSIITKYNVNRRETFFLHLCMENRSQSFSYEYIFILKDLMVAVVGVLLLVGWFRMSLWNIVRSKG